MPPAFRAAQALRETGAIEITTEAADIPVAHEVRPEELLRTAD